MDPPANHQNPIDIDNWFHYYYFDQDHDSSFFPFDALGYVDDVKLEVLDHPISRVPLLEQTLQNNVSEELGIQDFDPFEDFSLWGCSWDDFLPLLSDDQCQVTNCEAKNSTADSAADHGGRKRGRRIRPVLELEEIEKHFEMPIIMAAKKMKIGLTALKKRCRELNIKRWPHRKLKSLQSVIHNAKELGLHEEKEIEMVEEQKRMMEKLPDLELTQSTKKLRQACFKANYKKRRLNSP